MAVYLGSKMLTDLRTGDEALTPENIKEGAEVFGVVGTYKGDEVKYELIETITCDGSYGNVARTGLALKRAKIYLHTTAATATATIVAEISNGAGFFGYVWAGNAINTADRWTFINIVSDGDDAYVEYTAAAAQSYNAGTLARTANRFDGKTPISRFNMYVGGGATFPAGSIIEIWGVRA